MPLSDSGYRRTFSAEIDVLTKSELLVRGMMGDERLTLEHTWTLRTPEYEVIDASARQAAGDESQFSPELCLRYRQIKGVRIGRGFSKHILTALGGVPGTQEHLFLAIEMARVGQQIYQFPPEFEKQFATTSDSVTEAARAAWLKDRAYMSDLRNSCYTYRDESAELFGTREVHCGFDQAITRPRPGTRRAFWRNKRLVIRASTDDKNSGFACESAMADSIHDIAVSFEISRDGVISNAHSRGLRLPYYGLCEDPHQRTPRLNGQRVTADYVRQFADQIGGAAGCTHLFDLSIDVLRLFRFSD